MDHTFANIENFMRDAHEQTALNAAEFASSKTQIINIEGDVKCNQEDITKNRKSINKLKRNNKTKSVGKWAAWATIIASLITGASLILVGIF